MKHKEKKIQEDLRTNAATTSASIQPTEFEKLKSDQAINFINQSQGSGGIEGIDALKPYLNLYNSAISDQKADRQSNGILNLARGGNPAQAQALDTYMKYKRQQDAAGNLENAYNATNADLTGQGFNLAQMANSRNLGKASLAQQAYSTYLNRPKTPGVLDRILQFGQLAVQGASAFGA